MRAGFMASRGGSSLVAAAAAVLLPSSSRLPPLIVRCSSSSAASSVVVSASVAPPTTGAAYDHTSFIKDVAATMPPEHLNCLLSMLEARGETVVSPGAKEGLLPLCIPLSENLTGNFTSLLRWPTSPPGMEMPVVEVRKHGVWLLAKSVDQYIHRMLVEEDANTEGCNVKLWNVSSEAGERLYIRGDFLESGIANIDTYIFKKVGFFPDIIERKVSRHLEKGDQVSAMITGEFYTKNHFPGFGRPFAFNAELLLKSAQVSINDVLQDFFSMVGRKLEAKDAARGALKSPWWTLGCRYHEIAEIAEWEDEQIEYLKEKVTEEGKQEDLKKGKAPEQVALDEAAFLLDLASIDGTWDEVVDRIAQCYVEAGLHDMARFILYRE